MDTDDQQEAVRDLIRRMMEKTGLDATGLARAAGLAPSTLSRFLYQPVKHILTARTLAKLSKAGGIPVPIGGPLLDPLEREVLAGLRSTDAHGRELIIRLVRSLNGRALEAEPSLETPADTVQPRSRGPDLPPFRAGGNAPKNRKHPIKADCWECAGLV